jgi:hypothetical protein
VTVTPTDMVQGSQFVAPLLRPSLLRFERHDTSIAVDTFAEDIMSNLLSLLGNTNLTEDQFRPLSGLANI